MRKAPAPLHGACSTMLDDAEMADGEATYPRPRGDGLAVLRLPLEGDAANDCYDAGSTNKKLLAKAERGGRRPRRFYPVLPRIRDRRAGAGDHNDDRNIRSSIFRGMFG